MTTLRITFDQLLLIRKLHQRLRIRDPDFDHFVEQRYGCRPAELSRRDASALIDELTTWKDIPPDIRRAIGQLDLFG